VQVLSTSVLPFMNFLVEADSYVAHNRPNIPLANESNLFADSSISQSNCGVNLNSNSFGIGMLSFRCEASLEVLGRYQAAKRSN
jgi:hypothetical protein